MKKEIDNNKLTLEQYQEKYNKKASLKKAKTVLFVIFGVIGILLIYLLTLIVLKLFELHKIVGYVSIGVALLVFIIVYIVPICKIYRSKSFIRNVNKTNLKNAKKANRNLRKELATKIVEFSNVTDNIGWYDETRVEPLRTGLANNDDEAIKKSLSAIYQNDIKKTANKIISKNAIKVGLLTAASQSEKLDSLIMSLFELDLIKQIIYLYGFRPNDDELVKIYFAVIRNALIAYGLQSITATGTGIIGKTLEKSLDKSIPVLGSAISTLIGSASQGIINGTLTVILGKQTKKYLKEAFRLQEVLDNVIEDDEQEEQTIMDEVKKSITKETKKSNHKEK